jgi:peroxiredoxin
MLLPGAKAPDFRLPAVNGDSLSLTDAIRNGPALVVFFKVSCPTCQFTLPFLNRIAEAQPDQENPKLRIVAVSQDDAGNTAQFLERFAPRTTTLLDNAQPGYPTCRAYAISHVPSLFLVEKDGSIAGAADGFHRQMIEDIGAIAGVQPFRPGEQVPELRPG